MHSLLSRSVRHAMARDKVKRNVVLLCDVPTGQAGRRSKSLSFNQAETVLDAAQDHALRAYVVLSLLLAARRNCAPCTGTRSTSSPTPPSIAVYRSVRAGGDTRTTTSRRRLTLPQRCVDALHRHLERLARSPAPNQLVLATSTGTELAAHNVRRSFRRIVADAGLEPGEWTPRELRHLFVSLLSASGVRIEDISRLVGHSGTAVTEKVYRHQLHVVLDEGARAMDEIVPERAGRSAGVGHSVSHSPPGDRASPDDQAAGGWCDNPAEARGRFGRSDAERAAPP